MGVAELLTKHFSMASGRKELEDRACHRRRLNLASEDDAYGPSEASLTEVAEGFGPLAGPPAEDEEGQEPADEVEQPPGDPQPGFRRP